jgi:hypothetical protein
MTMNSMMRTMIAAMAVVLIMQIQTKAMTETHRMEEYKKR